MVQAQVRLQRFIHAVFPTLDTLLFYVYMKCRLCLQSADSDNDDDGGRLIMTSFTQNALGDNIKDPL